MTLFTIPQKFVSPAACLLGLVTHTALGPSPALGAFGSADPQGLIESSVVVERRSEPVDEDAPAAAEDTLTPVTLESDHTPEPAGPRPAEAAMDTVADEDADEDVVETNEVLPSATPAADTGAVGDSTDAASVEESVSNVLSTTGRATFRGCVPGETTKEELLASWGEPDGVAETSGGEVLLYRIPAFGRVDVLIENAAVDTLRLQPIKRETVAKVEARLRFGDDMPVSVVDPESGETLAVAYPEKCLMLLLSPAEEANTPDAPQLVTRIVIGQPDAEAFALRAESRQSVSLEARLADLKRAMEIDPGYGYASYLAAGLYLSTGQVASAVDAAEAAVKAEPDNVAYRLRRAQAWFDKGEYDQAVIETRAVLDSESKDSVVKAAALHTMGLLAGYGDSRISDKAIGFHTMAISLADKMATTADAKDRRAAKRLLVDAHLAIAKEVSRRDYDQKTEVVAQWIGRASSLAEEMLSNDQGGLELRMTVAREALAALAHLKPTKDPQPWLDEAVETAAALRRTTDDPLMTARIEWMLGEAYYHAVRVEHTRGQAENAVANGQKAIEHLMAGAASGDIRPAAEQLVGRLYFHLGAANAVHLQDHEQAVEWYDQAYPLLTSEGPKSKLYVPRRKGEALVSMAVSYWSQDQKDRAVELTTAGAELMERAVKAGVLQEKSLGVPYSNLATMHRRLGDEERSSEFALLARNARGGIATASRPTRSTGASPQVETQPEAEPARRPAAPRRRSAGGKRTQLR